MFLKLCTPRTVSENIRLSKLVMFNGWMDMQVLRAWMRLRSRLILRQKYYKTDKTLNCVSPSLSCFHLKFCENVAFSNWFSQCTTRGSLRTTSATHSSIFLNNSFLIFGLEESPSRLSSFLWFCKVQSNVLLLKPISCDLKPHLCLNAWN